MHKRQRFLNRFRARHNIAPELCYVEHYANQSAGAFTTPLEKNIIFINDHLFKLRGKHFNEILLNIIFHEEIHLQQFKRYGFYLSALVCICIPGLLEIETYLRQYFHYKGGDHKWRRNILIFFFLNGIGNICFRLSLVYWAVFFGHWIYRHF